MRNGEVIKFEKTFSMEDAKKAKLSSKGDNWDKYPVQMLEARAKSFCVRNAFPDFLGGIYSREELEQNPKVEIIEQQPTQEVKQEIIHKEIESPIKEPIKEIKTESEFERTTKDYIASIEFLLLEGFIYTSQAVSLKNKLMTFDKPSAIKEIENLERDFKKKKEN